MHKLKKLSALILSGVLTITLSGCLGNTPEPTVDLSNPDPKTPTQTTTDNKDNTDPGTDINVPDTPDTQEEIAVVQSGEAVRYKDQILFREYYDSSIDNLATWGEFPRSNTAYNEGTLYTFDPADPTKITRLSEDPGFGDFYLVNEEDLYGQACPMGSYDPDTGKTNFSVYRKQVASDQYETIGYGTIQGFAPDGNHFAVYDYSLNPYLQHLYVYDTSENNNLVAEFVSDTEIHYLGMDNDNMYVLCGGDADDGSTYDIIQIDYKGNEYYLGLISLNDLTDEYFMTYPEYYDTISYDADSISFRLDFYEGTGHFYYSSIDVSVPIAKNETPTTDTLFETTIKENSFEDDPNYDLPKELSPFQSYPEYESGRGFAKVIQYYNEFDEGTFFAIADCHRTPEEDIGWRETYYFLNLTYCFLPAGSKEYVILGTMFDDLGVNGTLYSYDDHRIEPTLYVYAGFFYDENKKLVGIYYEPIEVQGPEAPIIESGYTFIADIADDFHYEYFNWEEDWDSEDFFIVTDLDEFTELVYSWTADDYKGDCLKAAEYDYEGYLVFGSDDYSFEQYNSYMCHIAFDSEGNVNYIRPVLMD